MILADTSIWVDHFRSVDPELERLIASGRILMHPFIVAELALGSLASRRTKLDLMEELVKVEIAETDEVIEMIETRRLYSKGIGLVDAHLIASCLITSGTQLWTRDIRLGSVATALGINAKALGNAHFN